MLAGEVEIRLMAEVARLRADMDAATNVVRKNTKQMETLAQQASKSFGQMGSHIRTVLGTLGIALGVRQMASFVQGVIDIQDEVIKLSPKLNMSIGEIVGLKHAVELTGVSFEGIQKGLKSLSSSLFDASMGLKTATDSFELLKINIRDGSGNLKSTTTILDEIADAFAGMEDSTEKTALAVKLFGRAGLDMIPLLNGGSEALRTMADEGRKLLPITEESAMRAEEWNDNVQRLSTSFQGAMIPVIDAVLPLLVAYTDSMIESEKAGNGMSQTIISLLTPLKAIALAFLTMGTVVATMADNVLGAVFALNELRKFNFAGAMDEWAIATQRAGERIRGLGEAALTLFGSAKPKAFKETATGDEFLDDTGRDPKIRLTPTATTTGGGDPLAKFKGLLKGLQDQLRLESELTQVAKTQRTLDEMSAKDLAAISPLRRAQLLDLARKVDLMKAELAQTELLQARAKNEVDAIKGAEAQKMQALEFARAQNTVSDEAYFAAKIASLTEVAKKEIALINLTLVAQRDAQSKTAEGSAAWIKAQQEIEASQAAIVVTTQALGLATQGVMNEATMAAKAYKMAIEDLDAELQSLDGNTADGAIVQFKRKWEKALAEATAQGDQATIDKIGALQARTGASAGMSDEQTKLTAINAQLSLDEQRIQNLRSVGAISELDAMQRTGEARQGVIAQQEVIVRNLERIAKESGSNAMVLQADQARVALEKLKMESDVLGLKFEQIFSSSAGSALNDFISGTKSAKEAFKSFSDSVVKQINAMVSEALSKELFKVISGTSGPFNEKVPGATGDAGGIGGIFGKMFSGGLGKLFGGGQGAANDGMFDSRAGVKQKPADDPCAFECDIGKILQLDKAESAFGSVADGFEIDFTASTARVVEQFDMGTRDFDLLELLRPDDVEASFGSMVNSFEQDFTSSTGRISTMFENGLDGSMRSVFSSLPSLFGSGSGGSSGGGGLGGILGGLGGLFGGGGGGGSPTMGASLDLIDMMGMFNGFANGSDFVPRTQLAVVHQGEKIIPASENRQATQMPPVQVTNVFHISGQTDQRSQAQISAAAGQGVNRALARNT